MRYAHRNAEAFLKSIVLNFPSAFVQRRPGIKNFQRRASEHGRYFFLLKRKLQKNVSTAASASERERPDVEIFISVGKTHSSISGG